MLKSFKPITPGQRGTVLVSKKELWSGDPYKKLIKSSKSTGGRNNQGRITSRRMGGGAKRKYRVIDFKRNKFDKLAEVIRKEYDPNSGHRHLQGYYMDRDEIIGRLSYLKK